VKTWCLSPASDAAFVYHMEDVLQVYQLPYDAERPVVCMDEASKQLLGETRVPLPTEPGAPLREDYEYERLGVVSEFVFVQPLRGWRHVIVTDRRTKHDWALCIQDLLDRQFPDAKCVRLVLDNLNTHTGAALYETFAPAEARRLLDRLEFHYTPKHASWLNMAEIEIGVSRLNMEHLRFVSGLCRSSLVSFEIAMKTPLNYARKRAFRNRPVCDALQAAMASGVPVATTSPPA
jgi:hypothetical protein